MNKSNLSRIAVFGVIGIILLTNLLVWSKVVLASPNRLVVKVLDVGQGDSIFIRSPDNYKILVDGGPNNKVVEHLNKELGLNERDIDLVVLTHPQADHMAGLIETIKKFKVKKVITSNITNTTSMYKLWIDTLNNHNLKPEFVSAGQSITLSDQVSLQIVWPADPKPEVTDLNAACIVIKLSYGSFDMLLTGDADSQVQPYTTSLGHVEVLKTPHHGSKTGITQEFIQELSPNVSVISVGANNHYGHPNPKALELFDKNSKKVFRTDQNGTVTFVSDGQKWYTQLAKD